MTGLEKLLVASVAVEVGLTFWLLFWLGRVRWQAVVNEEIHIRDIALDASKWPEAARKVSNAVDNQFQLPVLFYIAATLALVTSAVNLVTVALSIGFVVLRLLHAWILVTSNNVPRRFQVYSGGFLVLIILWAYLVADLLLLR
ncbi:MAG: MAPEG family protein [Cucumibacter sp.]